LILSFHLWLDLLSVPLKFCMYFSSLPCVLHVPPISSSMAWCSNNSWWRV
jgi:hypothetical protein